MHRSTRQYLYLYFFGPGTTLISYEEMTHVPSEHWVVGDNWATLDPENDRHAWETACAG